MERLMVVDETKQLAKTSVSDGIEVNITPSYSELLPKYKLECFKDWKEYFNKTSLEKGIWYKTIQCEPPRIPWFVNTKLSRKFVIIAHRLRSGHIPLNGFRHLMGKSDSPNCAECGRVEDVHHLLVECVRTRAAREVLMNTFKINLIDVGFIQSTLSEPLSNAAVAVYKIVNKVLESTNR
uniref:SFRICE_025130 n=1 Tax=Spodoptera frugiperda TaxID=7108 RepID=A0A2H1W033_SPOFR